jgi:hypothetical protein
VFDSCLRDQVMIPFRQMSGFHLETGEEHFLPLSDSRDRLCGLVVRVPGYTTEMYCASCEVRTVFILVYVM